MNNLYNSDNNFLENNKKPEEEPLALLNLEIEKGVVKQIKLFKNSNPEEVAYTFCKENNIDFSLMNHIKNEIESLLQKYFENLQKETETKDNNNISSNNNEQNEEQNYNNNNNDEILSNNYNSTKFINQSKNNVFNNNQNNKRNLFFYQFLQNEKNRNKQKNLNKSKSAKKYKIQYCNTINSNKSKNKIKYDPKNSGSSSLRHINDSYLTHNFTTINNNYKTNNIFERLYNDAKIKRVVYKRPCHYSSHSKEKKIFEDTMSNVYETINGKTINKMNLDMKLNYARSYQIRPNQLLSKECSFQPNAFKTSENYVNTIDSNHLNSTYHSHNFHDDKSSYKYLNTNYRLKNNIFNTKYLNYNNYLRNNQIKNNVLFEENYVPLKNKIKFFSIIEDNLETLSLKAFSNLFNLLINNDENQLLNKNTININNIDNNAISILSQMIQDINNNNLELNFDDFLKRIFNEISDEDKKFLIYNYSNSNNYKYNFNNQNFQGIRNTENFRMNNYIKNKSNKNSENNSRTSTINNFHKRYRLTSGTEKKRNFYYI